MIYNKKYIDKIENNICYPKNNIDWVDFFLAVKAIVKREYKPINCKIYDNVIQINSNSEYGDIIEYL